MKDWKLNQEKEIAPKQIYYIYYIYYIQYMQGFF